MVSGLRLDGQSFAITGASRGIGREYALLLARLGANLVLNSSSAEALEPVLAEVADAPGRAVAAAGDVSDPAVTQHIVDTALDRFGALDGVVANAGMTHGLRPFAEIGVAELRRAL